MCIATYDGDYKDMTTALADEYVIRHRGVHEPRAMVGGSCMVLKVAFALHLGRKGGWSRAPRYESEHHV